MKKIRLLNPVLGIVCTFIVFQILAGCTKASTSDTAPVATTGCTLTDNTSVLATSSLGCAKLSRDTSSCLSSRQTQGLSGFWLKFSCRVTLTKSGSNVIITTDGQPDHKSPYFATSNACYEAGFPAGRAANPNKLGTLAISMTVPFAPGTPSGSVGTAMSMGVIGIALNGVAIFSNAAAPGDNIYAEVATFDKCEGHPAGTKYHYHIEPTTVSDSDSNFIGVMRDGFPVYGRYEPNGAVIPTLDKASAGGHLGTTPDSTVTSVYHYHVNLQTSGADSAYFITSGFYMGSAGVCTGCL
jgi:hypothetical protein